jgi:hypothetical protein
MLLLAARRQLELRLEARATIGVRQQRRQLAPLVREARGEQSSRDRR